MRQTVKHMLALLIVFSASLANAVDSSSIYSNCRIMEEENMKYRVEFFAEQQQLVKFEIWDKQDKLVYENQVKSTSFVRTFDLSHLPNGEYELKISSDDYQYSEDITIDDLKGMNLRFVQREERKVAMVGSKLEQQIVSLYILDENDEIVFKQNYDGVTQVHKVFNFEELRGDQVTFILFDKDNVVSQEVFEF
ncbi:MAG: hypothetical protein JXR10_04710 [Cyclobacteriaceae bacterium]